MCSMVDGGAHLADQAQVPEEAAQGLVEAGQPPHAVLPLAALLVLPQGLKVLGGHGAAVLPHALPVAQQLPEPAPGDQRRPGLETGVRDQGERPGLETGFRDQGERPGLETRGPGETKVRDQGARVRPG